MFVFLSRRRRNTICEVVTGVQTCALPFSWANHDRRMLPSLLSVREFLSNNAVWRPVLAALDWIRSKVDGGCRFVPLQDVPIDEVIPARWRSSVIDDDGRVNRISYELCVLTQLRDRIRSKEIWVVGADRY